MEIHVRPLQRTLNVAPGTNLLDALRNNDVPISHSCMAGRCGTCRCKIVAGQVLDSGREVQQPLAAQDAYVLACQTFGPSMWAEVPPASTATVTGMSRTSNS